MSDVASPPKPRWRRKLLVVTKALLLLGLFLLTAEVVARLDDWYQLDVPLTSNHNRKQELTIRDEYGVHGRPHGRYEKWKLNSLGFRGPEIALEPPPATTRILLLGASETFGLLESEGKEYAAQLSALLREQGRTDVEVVNAAMPGISLPTLRSYWEQWASRSRPHIVMIYPSPIFYLDESPPGPDRDQPAPRFESRFAGRAMETVRKIEWLKPIRIKAELDWKIRGKDADWLYRTTPADRLDLFRTDLDNLVNSVKERGARPVLITHAVRVTSPPRKEDLPDLRDMRRFALRATEETIAGFEVDCVNAVRKLGKEHAVPVIDAAEALGGQREWFGDLAHFNDRGAEEMAKLLAERIERLVPPPE